MPRTPSEIAPVSIALEPARAGSVRANRPSALRGRRAARVAAPAAAAFAITGLVLVGVAQGAATPADANAAAPSVDELTQAQAQSYSVALVVGEPDALVTGDRGGDAGTVTVATPEPAPAPAPANTSGSSGSGDSGSSGGSSAPTVVVDATPGSAQAIAQEMVAARGWGADQYQCLYNLWEKESNWRVDAENSSSGAYGIPQSLPGSKMATVGSDWRTNPATQIEWGLGYISSVYGTPCGAWGHSQSNGWY